MAQPVPPRLDQGKKMDPEEISLNSVKRKKGGDKLLFLIRI